MSFQFPSMESGHRHRKNKCRTGPPPFLHPAAHGLAAASTLSTCSPTPFKPVRAEGQPGRRKRRLSLRSIHSAQAQDPGQICSNSSPISSIKGGIWHPHHLNKVVTSWLEPQDTGILAFQMNCAIQVGSAPFAEWCSEVLSKQALVCRMSCFKCTREGVQIIEKGVLLRF